MSDILGRLAARVLAPERAIRPRMHSPFESYGSLDIVDDRQAPGGDLVVPSPIQPAATPRSSSHAARTPIPETEIVREVPREVVHDRIQEFVRDDPRPGEAEPRTMTVRERPSDSTGPACEPSAAPQPRIETQTILRERRTVERSERLERVDRLHVRRERERSEITRTIPVTTPVEITIGRIDVRAVVGGTTQPPPARQRERAPTMSLRDYLARRDERRHR